MPPPILIAGAGVAGLCTAIGLLRAGFEVQVLEQAPELGEVGAGLSLAPNATRALASLGVLPEVRRRGQLPDRAEIRHYATAACISGYTMGPAMEAAWGAPYVQIQRSELQAVLLAALLALDPAALRLGARVQTVQPREDGVTVHTGSSRLEGSCLLAADGVRSVVRSQLFAQPQARFLGYVAWRSLLPRALVELPLAPDTALFIGPGRSLLRYLLGGGELVNVAAFARHDAWVEESWSARADPADIAAAFGAWHAEPAAIAAAMCRHGATKWGLFGREYLPSWRHGRVVLVGDAAHPMLPFLGQGAAQGIEDAVVLARAFALCGTVDAALAGYERARFERAMTTMARADRQGLHIHGHLDDGLAPARAPVEAPRDDFAEYGYDAAAVRFDGAG